jgi:hypothetical protein
MIKLRWHRLTSLDYCLIVGPVCEWWYGWLTEVSPLFSGTEYDIPVFEKSGKGGTYPRRYGIPFSLQDYSDGES